MEPCRFVFYLGAAVAVTNQQQESVSRKRREGTHQVEDRLRFSGSRVILVFSNRKAAHAQDDRPVLRQPEHAACFLAAGPGRPRFYRERKEADSFFRNPPTAEMLDRKSTRLNSSHSQISYAVFCL